MAVITPEEVRADERLLKPLAAAWRGGRMFAWTTTRGFAAYSTTPEDEPVTFPAPDPVSALDVVASFEEPAIFVLKDFHHYVDNAVLLRKLRDLAISLVPTGKHVIF